MSNLLFDSEPLLVNTDLAVIIGLNEAIVLQQIHYWLNINQKAKKNYYESKYWTYNSVAEWKKQFPFWSYETVKRTLLSLRKINLLTTGSFNKAGFDKTLWYTIDYEWLNELHEFYKRKISEPNNDETIQLEKDWITNLYKLYKNKSAKANNPETLENTHWVKMTQRVEQNEPMDKGNLLQPIPETTTEISKENNLSIDQTQKTTDKMDRSLLSEKSQSNYKEIIAENIELEALKADNPHDYIVDDIYNLMIDTVQTKASTIRIGKEDKPRDIVKSVFLKLNQGHVEYVIEQLRSYASEIKNTKAFTLTCLYNAYSTSNISILSKMKNRE